MAENDSRTLLVVLALPEPLAVGQTVDRRAWPAHVTLASNFVVSEPSEVVVRVVTRACAVEPPLVLRFGDRAWFGPLHDIPVQLVESPQIVALHERLADALHGLAGFAVDAPAYWRDGYRPHMTHVPGVSTASGTSVRLPFIAIASMTGRSATVISALELGKDAGGT
ncbi:2'-5' RNA ligase family protein [Microbacterium jejuense]|uniref:2'-5' RNA ligase family protein n=1 Tax=Microbacterium jejuense TaxID=1263637 RepID=A0ABS7HN64_9MICO|nr:2'-5' RNA ligase family protein [Microbacterium jejuense]MBW9093870.1 2'-5' RNA ligase family protein [Microbacterium jejuense]